MSRERDERMWSLADKMARSGEHSGWLDIEHELREQGYSRARYLLDDKRTRKRLDRLCADSRKDKANA